jgi:hypothetical protein
MDIALRASTLTMIEASPLKNQAKGFMAWLKAERYADYVIDCHLRRFIEVAPETGEPGGKVSQERLLRQFSQGLPCSSRRHNFIATGRAQWLGHAGLNTTMRYARADLDLKRKALAQLFPDAIAPPPGGRLLLEGTDLVRWLRKL